jgi:hypothetical protein
MFAGEETVTAAENGYETVRIGEGNDTISKYRN